MRVPRLVFLLFQPVPVLLALPAPVRFALPLVQLVSFSASFSLSPFPLLPLPYLAMAKLYNARVTAIAFR